MRAAIINVTLVITLALSWAGCGNARPTEGATSAPTLSGTERQALILGNEPRAALSGICPQAWTCDHRHWYGTESACHTFCGPTCERDFRCGLGCVCP